MGTEARQITRPTNHDLQEAGQSSRLSCLAPEGASGSLPKVGGCWNSSASSLQEAVSEAVSPPVAARLLPDGPSSGDERKRPGPRTRPDLRCYVVGATGFEPVTSSVSAKPREALC